MPGRRAAQGDPERFVANLDGAQMVPPVETTATGIANLTFDNSTSEFTWEISHSLPLSDVIGAHIREGEVGENGGIVIPLDHTENPMVGAAALTGEQAADLMAELWYIQIHTADQPGGEIRGQIVRETPPPPDEPSPAPLPSAARRHGVRRLVVRGSVDPRAAAERVVMRFRAGPAARAVSLHGPILKSGPGAVR